MISVTEPTDTVIGTASPDRPRRFAMEASALLSLILSDVFLMASCWQCYNLVPEHGTEEKLM